MSFSSIFRYTFFFLLALFSLVSYTVFQMNLSDHLEDEAYQRQEELRLLGEQLADGSNYLKNEIRHYVQFGNKVHYDNFWKEIRETRSRDMVVKRLIELEVSPHHLAHIKKAKEYSDKLIKTEKTAMEEVKRGHLEKARELVFGHYYDEQKNLIMENIGKFQDGVNDSAHKETQTAQSEVGWYMSITNFLLFFSGMVVLFLVYFVAINKLIKPIKSLTHLMLELAEGKLKIEIPTVPQKNEIGEIVSTLRVFKENMKKRIELEGELKKTIHSRDMILNSVGEGICGLDLNETITFANPAAEKMLRYPLGKMTSQTIHDLMHNPESNEPHNSQKFPQADVSIENADAHQSTEVIFWRKDGSSFPADYIATPVLEDGSMKGSVVVFKDITERKQAEEKILFAQKKLIAAEKLAGVGEMAAGVCHEVLNPLNIISLNNQLLRKKTLDDSHTQDFCGKVEYEIDRIQKIIRSLLSFSRTVPVKMEKGFLRLEIETVLALVEETFKLNNITIKREWSNESVQVLYDPDKLKQVFLNLFHNAKYAMPEGGTLTVDCAPVQKDNQTYHRVIISDSGVGMSEETRLKVFDPFFTTKPIGEGTGMGLSIVHGIIKEHGGSVSVESEIGKGTTFYLDFPLAPI